MRHSILYAFFHLFASTSASNGTIPYQFHVSMASVKEGNFYLVDWVFPSPVSSQNTLLPQEESTIAFGISSDSLNVFVMGRFNGFVPQNNENTEFAACYSSIIPLSKFIGASSVFYALIQLDAAKNVVKLSDTVQFVVPKPAGMRWAIFGDLGSSIQKKASGISFPALLNDFKNGVFQGILNIGDLGYELVGANGKDYIESFIPMTQHIPMQTTVGNHEFICAMGPLFSLHNYRTRFAGMGNGPGTASGSHSPQYYSFDSGKIHFIFLNSEVYGDEPYGYYTLQTGQMPVWVLSEETRKTDAIVQRDWLMNDLASVDRSKTSFIVLCMHRPPFKTPGPLETGGNGFARDIVPLLDQYRVNLMLTGHEHTSMIFNETQVLSGKYYFPKLIIVGAAGNNEYVRGRSMIETGSFHEALLIEKYGYGYLEETQNGLQICIGSTASGEIKAPVPTAWTLQTCTTIPNPTSNPSSEPVKNPPAYKVAETIQEMESMWTTWTTNG
uniref:Uncharacterized protein AlNc14C103G6102 n=1 Tax=Albugo laibachii Nc14 TaxID=890382 RepID=F0WHP5_9STRA|nr:conserved hypothetical protein [Albugo laibachii Nc14]CCA23724.1 conserved hypothetical protein [Albugo laibachii Nc14]|eukprot:CCA23724.1 conserved hypothetical protein [Albugo laibachii Nc14]